MGWLSGLIRRLKTGHAQGTNNVAMRAVQRCVNRFPEVFDVDPWEEVSPTTLDELHVDAEYSLASRGLISAHETILDTGDHLNASVALVELAKLHTRARDWQQANSSTSKAVTFCAESCSLDKSNRDMGLLNVDALFWRGAYLQFGAKDFPKAREVYGTAKRICQALGDREGISLVEDFEVRMT